MKKKKEQSQPSAPPEPSSFDEFGGPVPEPAPTLPELPKIPRRNGKVLEDYLRETYTRNGDSVYDATLDVCSKLLEGVQLESACLGAGYEPDEIKQLMQTHQGVFRAIHIATIQNEIWWVEKIKKSADRDWKAAAFYLSRAYPHIYGEVVSVAKRDLPSTTFKAGSGDTSKIDPRTLSDDELLAYINGRSIDAK